MWCISIVLLKFHSSTFSEHLYSAKTSNRGIFLDARCLLCRSVKVSSISKSPLLFTETTLQTLQCSLIQPSSKNTTKAVSFQSYSFVSLKTMSKEVEAEVLGGGDRIPQRRPSNCQIPHCQHPPVCISSQFNVICYIVLFFWFYLNHPITITICGCSLHWFSSAI